MWAGLLKDGTLSGCIRPTTRRIRFDESGKLPKGKDSTTFKEMANGVPGIELRLPLLFSEGVIKRAHRRSTSSSR